MNKTKLDKIKTDERKAEIKALLQFSYFRNLINNESKKRKVKPGELLMYFAEHKKELLEFLEELSPSSKKKIIKTLIPKFSKIYTHSEMENILKEVLVGEKLKNKGMQTVDIPMIGEESITGEVMVWENKGIEYFVKADDILKLDGKNPKAFATQWKNISLLMGITQEQQYNNSTKEAKCEFAFPYYAERRGYTKEEIIRGGNFLKELRRDLMTGAYTTYRIDRAIIEGKEYTAHGIPNFYILYEPKEHENKWKVEFNNPYNSWIIKILKGEAKQYFITDPKAIEDRITTEKPYLFLFYIQLTKRKQKILTTKPIKIINLLKDMKIDEQILARPKECFELIRECLIYFNENYKPTPEIESFNLYNDFYKTKTVKLPLSISEAFKKYVYKDFKEILKSISIEDIRESYISFKRPHTKPKSSKYKLTKEDEELRDNILEWTEEWEKLRNYSIEKTEEERRKYIDDRIRQYGNQLINDLFEEEKNKKRPSAYHFLFCTLTGRENEDMDWDYY